MILSIAKLIASSIGLTETIFLLRAFKTDEVFIM